MKRVRKNWRRWTLKTLNVWVIFMMLFQPIGTPGMIVIAEELSAVPAVEEKAPAPEPVKEEAPAPVKEEAPAPKEDVVEPAPAPEADIAPVVPEIPAVELAPAQENEAPAEPVVEPISEPAEEVVPAEVVADPAVLPFNEQGEITPEAASTEISSPEIFAVGEWRENEDGSMTVLVEEGGEYEYKNSGLKIKFTRIDSGTGEITVKEIELTDEQMDNLNALSRTAWDITSKMADGTFEYALTFPEVENVDQEKVEVIYVEKKADLDDEEKIKTVEDEDVSVDNEKKEITIEADHFTVFVAVETYLDLALMVSSDTFAIGSSVYTEATDLNNSAGDYYKISIFKPLNVSAGSSSCMSGVSSIKYNYLIGSGSPVGAGWKVVVDEYADSSCSTLVSPRNFDEKDFTVIDKALEPITVESKCMEDAYGKNLVCTANDAPLVNVDSWNIIGDGCQSPDDEVTFKAKWKLQSNASQRYNVGLYFPIEGQASALNGQCSVSSLPNSPAPWYDFDNNICGDMASESVLYPEITLTVDCLDTDGDNNLDLPYCVSWEQKASTCNSPLDTIPGSPSKCGCDDGFEIPITVPDKAYMEVRKALVPNTDAGRFNLYIDQGETFQEGVENIGDSGTTGKITVGAGMNNSGATHTVGETAYSGTNLDNYTTSISCVDRGMTTFDGGTALTVSGAGPLSVDVDKDDDIVCTITNTRNAFCGDGRVDANEQCDDGNADDLDLCSNSCTFAKGHLIVQKTTFPAGDQTVFSINATSSTGGIITDGGSGTVTEALDKNYEVTPGTYSVAETVPVGWAKTGDTCQDVVVGAGETKNCLLTNSKLPTLKVIKNVINDNGGTKTVADFGITFSGGSLNFDGGVVSGTNQKTYTSQTLTLNAGNYTLSESDISGYAEGTWNCGTVGASGLSTEIALVAGQNVTCEITNNDQSATLIVEKILTTDDGSLLSCSDFSFKVNGGLAVPFDSSCSNQIEVSAGTYDVVEVAKDGFTTTYENCSNVVIPNGGSATCTIKNDDVAPTLTIVKKVINDDGGNETVGAFEIKMNDGGLSFGAGVPAGSATTYTASPTVSANTLYTLSEKDLAGYVEGTWSCKEVTGAPVSHPVTLNEGQNVICEITNDDIAPSVTLVKEVANNNGGTAGVNSFGLSIGGITVNSGQVYPVKANTAYAINETGMSSYEFVSITGNAKCPAVLGGTVTLEEGENITCTIKNDDKPGKLTVIKIVDNKFGGNLESDDFTINVSGSNPSPVSFPGSDAGTLVTLNAGGYNVTENLIDGYVPKYSADCSGTIAIGETKTCTITNEDQAPKLTLVKTVINNNGGKKQVSDFPLFVGSAQVASGEATTLQSNVEYVVSETGATGYSASVWSGACSPEGKITLKPGDNKTCYITNDDVQPKLTVTKIVNDNQYGDLEVSDFPLFVGTTSVVSGVQNGFNAGNYVISETGKPGYSAVISGHCDSNGNVSLSPGDVKACTITNTDTLGKIIIEKQTLPDGDNTYFDFTGDLSGSIKDGEKLEKIVVPGTYAVSESAKAGWDLTDLTCTEDGVKNSGESDAAGNTANVKVEANETVTCTFTNTKRSSITIVKDAINNNAQDFEFTNNFGNDNPEVFYLDDDSTATLLNTRTFEVLPGAYAISEKAVAGWQQESATCTNGETIDSVDVAPGEAVTCTFVNEQYAKIVLVKNAIGGNGEFEFDATGAGLPAEIELETVAGTASQTFADLDQDNDYSIEEEVPAGWKLTSATCSNGDPIDDITPNAGEVITCTFTNTKDATLTLVKTVENNNGGTAVADDFQGKIDGVDVPWGVAQVVSATTHTVSETTLPGYAPSTWGGGCATDGTVTLRPGENKTCTITNDDQQAYIIIDKTVVNDDGGTAKPDDFNLKVDGQAVLDEVKFPVVPGAHTAREEALPGYAVGTWGGDCNEDGIVTVALGETKTCTITNNDIAPKLTLKKEVVNDNGGNALASDWTLSATGERGFSGKGTQDGSVNKAVLGPNDVKAGVTYLLSESGPVGYTDNWWKCEGGEASGNTILLGVGAIATCTIVNDDVAPTLTVVKKVINDDGGNETVGAFEIKLNDASLGFGAGDVSDDMTTYQVSPEVRANEPYTLSEKDLAGYVEGTWSCKEVTGAPVSHPVTLNEGQNVICEITNNDIAGTLTLVKEVVKNNGGNALASQWTLSASGPTPISGVTGSVAVTNAPVSAGNYSLTESGGPAGYSPSAWVCTGGTQNGADIYLENGQSATCTITNDDIAPELKVCKFYDYDGDKIKDEIEDMLPGWTMTVTKGASVIATGSTGADGCVQFENLAQGNYAVTETLQDDWRAVTGISQNVELALGDEKTIYFGNQRLGVLVVYKDVVDPQGNPVTDKTNNFKVTLDGSNEQDITDEGMVIYDGLVAGMHTINESFIPEGYELLSIAPDSDAGTAGAQVAVLPEVTTNIFITNKQKPATLTVTKKVTEGFGSATPDQFGLNVNDVSVSSGVKNNYPANLDLIVAEGELPGYVLQDIVCTSNVSESDNIINATTLPKTINLVPGEEVACTITNTDTLGKIIIEKQTLPDGDNTYFDFTGDLSGSIKDGEKLEKIVVPGTYAVSESAKAGWDLTDLTCTEDGVKNSGESDAAGNTANVKVEANETVTCVFTNTKRGSVFGVKYEDVDGNGVNNGEEVGLSGWMINLFDETGDGLFASTTTDASGNYGFTNVIPGNYQICEENQSGWLNTDPGAGQSMTACKSVTVLPEQDKLADFGNFQLGEIKVCKYTDYDGNGNYEEADDLPLANINFKLSISGDGWEGLKSQETGIDGCTIFTGLEVGNYKVEEDYTDPDLAGYYSTNGKVSYDDLYIESGSKETRVFLNAKYRTISGTKFNDLNGNGAWDAGEMTLEGWTIFLDYNSDGIFDAGEPSVVTDANGNYEFTGLVSDVYRVAEYINPSQVADGWVQTMPSAGYYDVDLHVEVSSGGNDFGNVELSDIHGFKWDDRNGNGERDCIVAEEEDLPLRSFAFNDSELQECELEPLLENWKIFIDNNWNGEFDEEEKFVLTSNDPDPAHYGWYWFEDLLPGQYQICEVQKPEEGWDQTYPSMGDGPQCHIVSLPNDCDEYDEGGDFARVTALNYVQTYCQFDFGNQFIVPELTIQKFNSQWPAPQDPGDLVDYTIIVKAEKNDVLDVKVTDLLPAGFEFVSGSSTKGLLTKMYASPGVWSLDDLAAGESVTITYRARIGASQDPGTYKDLAYAIGTDERNEEVLAGSVPAPTSDDGVVSDNFVGTRIALTTPTNPRKVELDEDIEYKTKTKERVLGASISLPATGASSAWVILAGALLLLGVALIGLGVKKRKKLIEGNNMLTKIITFALLGIAFLGFSQNALAAADPKISVRMEDQADVAGGGSFRISFVAMDIEGATLTAKCFRVDGPPDFQFPASNVEYVELEVGNSGNCIVDGIIAPTDGTYQFYAQAWDGNSRYGESEIVTVKINSAVPGTPVDYDRDDDSCTVTFKTANDGGLTEKVFLYRSDESEFVADGSTKVQEGLFGSGVTGSLTDPNGNCDDYYYVIQAVSAAGIGSGFVGDEESITKTETKTKTIRRGTSVSTARGVSGATGEGGEGTVPEEEGGEVAGNETDEEEQGEGEIAGAESSEILGEQTEFSESFFKNWKFWALVIIMAVAGWWYYNKKKKQPEIKID